MSDSAATKKTTYREAVREGLREALRSDPRFSSWAKTSDTTAAVSP